MTTLGIITLAVWLEDCPPGVEIVAARIVAGRAQAVLLQRQEVGWLGVVEEVMLTSLDLAHSWDDLVLTHDPRLQPWEPPR